MTRDGTFTGGLGAKAKPECFSRCKSHLDDADIVIAFLDGLLVDDGAAWQIGYFYANKSPEQKIIGIRPDFRRAGESQGVREMNWKRTSNSIRSHYLHTEGKKGQPSSCRPLDFLAGQEGFEPPTLGFGVRCSNR